MDNQHRKITGYRELDPGQIDRINAIKKLEAQAAELWLDLKDRGGIDYRAHALARTKFEEACMWLTKSVGRSASPFDAPGKDWLGRLVDECEELESRVLKLSAFLEGEGIKSLPEAEQARLRTQYDSMKAYNEVLLQRIEAAMKEKN